MLEKKDDELGQRLVDAFVAHETAMGVMDDGGAKFRALQRAVADFQGVDPKSSQSVVFAMLAVEVMGQHWFEWISPRCAIESPIESVFLSAVLAVAQLRRLGVCCPHEVYPDQLGTAVGHRRQEFLLETQKKIGSYRVDFLLTPLFEGYGEKTIIECDGHAFHDGDRDAAARDKKRDRQLQRLGFRVLRFTGRELYRDPMACAFEAMTSVTGRDLT